MFHFAGSQSAAASWSLEQAKLTRKPSAKRTSTVTGLLHGRTTTRTGGLLHAQADKRLHTLPQETNSAKTGNTTGCCLSNLTATTPGCPTFGPSANRRARPVYAR